MIDIRPGPFSEPIFSQADYRYGVGQFEPQYGSEGHSFWLAFMNGLLPTAAM